MSPSVSICVPTYNGARYLSACLESALGQTYRDFEVVIVDDASTDDTLEVAERFASLDERVRVVRNPRNLGLVGNWNRCIELARGTWVKFLFQDDYLAPTCLSVMLEQAGPATPFVVTARHVDFAPDSRPDVRDWYETHAARHLTRRRADWPAVVTAERFTECLIDFPTINVIGEPTATLIHRSLFDRFGPFNIDMRSLVDWEYFARIAVNTGLIFIKEPQATFRVHSDSATQRETRRSEFMNELEGLAMLHGLAYDPDFAPARTIAERRRPPVNFAYVLAGAVQEARSKARPEGEFDDRTRSDFDALLRRLPQLSIAPPGYARQRLREIHRSYVARFERILAKWFRRGQLRR